MNKLKFSLLLLCLGILTASPALSAQIGGKALGDVDDIVKETTHGSLTIPKHSLMLLRNRLAAHPTSPGYDMSFLQSNIMAFDSSGSSATKTEPLLQNNGRYTAVGGMTPAISRRTYNSKKVVMSSLISNTLGKIRTSFTTLQNNRTAVTETPQELVNTLSTSSLGKPYLSNFLGYKLYLFGSVVLDVKGYDGEVFVNVTGRNGRTQGSGFDVYMDFFEIHADNSGEPAFSKLKLTQTTHFNESNMGESETTKTVSVAAADLDDNGYVDNFAVLVNTNIDIRLYFYKLMYEDGTFKLKRLGNDEYKLYTTPEPYRAYPSGEASSALLTGDFDGDGKYEAAAVYKTIKREKYNDNEHKPLGRIIGDVCVSVFKWDFSKGAFASETSTKEYSYHKVDTTGFFSWLFGGNNWNYEVWSGVAGLKAVAADLDGDGKDEIVTLLIGYYARSGWNPDWKLWRGKIDDFDMYPYLAVWSCPRDQITPQHDESRVKGHGIILGPLATYGANQQSLFGEPLWQYRFEWTKYVGQKIAEVESSGREEPSKAGYTANYYSMAAGPFTGTLGTGKTIDDIVVSWNNGWDQDGAVKVYLFKTNINNKSFAGFSDANKVAELPSVAAQEISSIGSTTLRNWIWHGLLAADFAGEGVELDKPVHVKNTGDRSYITILNAPPYHVDTVSADGNSLTAAPHNFTYSGGGDGKMRVFYDNTTADDNTKAVTFDMSNSVETIFMLDSDATRKFFTPIKKTLSFAASFKFDRHAWDGTTWVDAALGAITDKIHTTDETVKTSSKTIILNDELKASTRDSIIFYNADRHIWRYPILTNPAPAWLIGQRIDSTSGDISDVDGNPDTFLTFALYDDGTKYVKDSVTDTEMKYQPIHEEGNFFSYPPALAANEGYISEAVLTDPTVWSVGTSDFNTSASFKEVSADERQTETKVERSTVTKIIEAFDRFTVGKNAPSYTPDTDNPQKFSKSYSKEEKIGFNLKGRSDLVNRGAGNEIAFQAYTGKEGAMTLATAVTLASAAPQNFLWRDSLYTRKADPALLLPFKFLEQVSLFTASTDNVVAMQSRERGSDFVANTDNVAAMQIRGMRYYLPELLSFTDNRLICGMDYKIHVPVYNASFKDTGNFTAQLSYSDTNTPDAKKFLLATTTISLGGWRNDRNNNKGWLVFDVPASATQGIASRNYYLWVDLDTGKNVEEVHEERMASDKTIVQDYGGNNSGYSPVVFVNMNSSSVLAQNGNSLRAAFSPVGFMASASGDVNGSKTTVTTSLTMNGMKNIADLITYLNAQEDHSERIPVLCEVTYDGDYVIPYATLTGYHVADSSQKLAEYDFNLDNIPKSEKEEFVFTTFAMIPGQTSSFIVRLCADDMIYPTNSANDTITYFEVGIPDVNVNFDWAEHGAVDIRLGDDTADEVYDYLADVAEEVSADVLTAINDVVTVAESRDFTLSKPSAVYWRLKEVKMRGSDNPDHMIDASIIRVHSMDLPEVDISFDENVDLDSLYSTFTPEIVPDNEVVVRVSSIPYTTMKAVYEVYVQTSVGKVPGDADDEDSAVEFWTDEEPLVFDLSGSGQSTLDLGTIPVSGTLDSPGGGCDSGLSAAGLVIGLYLLVKMRKR